MYPTSYNYLIRILADVPFLPFVSIFYVYGEVDTKITQCFKCKFLK